MTDRHIPDGDAHAPRLRASDDDREVTVARLREALTRGQLDLNEFDERAALAYRATFRDELPGLLADLGPQSDPPNSSAGSSPVRRRESPPPARAEQPGNRISLGLLGAAALSGDWTVARRHVSLGVLGAAALDLTEARLPAPETVIDAYAVMGAVEIRVPEDVRVLPDGFGVLGAFTVSDEEDVTLRQADLPPDARVLRVRGLGLMGAVVVLRVPRSGGR